MPTLKSADRENKEVTDGKEAMRRRTVGTVVITRSFKTKLHHGQYLCTNNQLQKYQNQVKKGHVFVRATMKTAPRMLQDAFNAIKAL